MGSTTSDHYRNAYRCYRRSHFLNIGVIFVVVVAYTTNNFLLKPNFNAYFLHGYFNDLFAMPFILGYTNLLILWVGGRANYFSTPIRIVWLTVFCVVIWEGLGPMLLANSTRDILDVASYSFGSFCYFKIAFVADQRSKKSNDDTP